MIFNGHYEHTIDAKHRLAVPAHVRSQMEAEGLSGVWYAVPWVGGVIRLYPEARYRAYAESMGELTLLPDEDEAELEATLFGLAARSEMDSAGRIRLTEDLLGLTELNKEVVLVGVRDRMEIHDRAKWVAEKQARLAKLPELMKRVQARSKPTAPTA